LITMDEIIIEGEKGRTFKIDLNDPIQKRYELVRELNLSSKKREEICTKYGYSRKTGNEYINAWEEEKWDGLKDNPRGPKTKSKRTEEIEKRIVDIRFRNPEKDMYDIAKILESEGHQISARSVGRVLSEHGITLKKTKQKPLPKSPKRK
jgi:transposase